LTVGANIVQTDDFLFDATVVFSRNQNEVLDLGSTSQSGLNVDPNTGMQFEFFGNSLEAFRQFPNILAVGQPINTFYGYKTDGTVQTLQEGINAGLDGVLAQPGEFNYVDLNGDGIIDTNDQTTIGDPNPDFTLSTTFNLEYKNFDFSLFLNGVFGQDILNTQAFNQPSNTPLRWTPDNPTNDYPSLRDGRQVKFSDWFLENGSFLRIQNVTAGYTVDLPKTLVNSMRVYLNINNLYTFTDFEGYDPEVGTNGIYYGGYPRLSQWTFGVNLTF
ncbi:hypothetical protein LCGC14_2865750, partial [marine sediment metagenome]